MTRADDPGSSARACFATNCRVYCGVVEAPAPLLEEPVALPLLDELGEEDELLLEELGDADESLLLLGEEYEPLLEDDGEACVSVADAPDELEEDGEALSLDDCDPERDLRLLLVLLDEVLSVELEEEVEGVELLVGG